MKNYMKNKEKEHKVDLEEIKKELQKILSEKRYNHSCRNNEKSERTGTYIWRR